MRHHNGYYEKRITAETFIDIKLIFINLLKSFKYKTDYFKHKISHDLTPFYFDRFQVVYSFFSIKSSKFAADTSNN